MHNFLSKDAVLFSLKTCLAALLSFSLAMLLNFDKPAWSLTSVYVVSQLNSAATISKSVYRLIGTILGGSFVFLIYPLTVNSPVLFSLCISQWVALCLYFSLRDRKPSNYIFMLGGYSAAIIGFPDVFTPSAISWTVISRIEEIALAIIVSSLVHSLLFPVSMRAILNRSLRNWFNDGREICGDIFLAKKTAKERSGQKKSYAALAAYPQTVQNMIAHCTFDGSIAGYTLRLASLQMKNLSFILPVLTAIEIRIRQLHEKGIAIPDYVEDALACLNAWASTDGGLNATTRRAVRLVQKRLKNEFFTNARGSEEIFLLYGLIERVMDFINIVLLYERIGQSKGTVLLVDKDIKLESTWHLDARLIGLSCFTAFIATFAACLYWIGSGWIDGASAPMIAAIVCSFYATTDKPTILMKTFLKGTLISAVISIFYIALIIPMAVSLEALIIALSPALVLLGLVIARSSTNLIGIIITAQIPAFIGMSHHFNPDLLKIVNQAISMVAGVVIAAVITAAIRNRKPAWTADRAFAKGITELAGFIDRTRENTFYPGQRKQYWLRTLDKSNVILSREKNETPLAELARRSIISEAWLGDNIYELYVSDRKILEKADISMDAFTEKLKYFLVSSQEERNDAKEALLVIADRMIILLEEKCTEIPALFWPLLHIYNTRLTIFPESAWPLKK